MSTPNTVEIWTGTTDENKNHFMYLFSIRQFVQRHLGPIFFQGPRAIVWPQHSDAYNVWVVINSTSTLLSICRYKKISAQIPSGKLTGRAVLGQLVFFCACLYQRALQVKERTHFEDISYVKER